MKITKTISLSMLLLATTIALHSQTPATDLPSRKQHSQKIRLLSIAFTNSHTALPFGSFSKLFTGPFHPGFEVGPEIKWSDKKKHDWFQNFRIGYSYHRLVQHSLVFYTEFGYRYKFPMGISSSVRLGGGYMRAIVANQVFADGQVDNQQYTKITSGRSQAIVMTTFNLSKDIGNKGHKFYIEYQQRLQTPFIQAYVDLLPYNIFLTGISIPLKKQH
jgi:hypothetical protein